MGAREQVETREPPVAQTVGLWVIAQDPWVRRDRESGKGPILTALVRVPAEHLEPGPRGARFQVVDYDPGTGRLEPPALATHQDPSKPPSNRTLTEDPGFRVQNVYAIAARTLAAFESALGRRLAWAFNGHKLYLVPRAFPEANAYYSPEDGAIFFGYLPLAEGPQLQTALSADVIAHETTHAVLDGLRPRFAEPGLPDQPAFHEAMGDIVALLSVFSVQDVVESLLGPVSRAGRLANSRLTEEALGETALFVLADELGAGLASERGSGLRRSRETPAGSAWRRDPAYDEAHKRGEVVVAAVLRTLLRMWTERLEPLRSSRGADRARVAEEGAKAADHLLRMLIRGIDYMPPVELEFEDVLEAVLNADEVLAPDDEHGYRDALEESFADFDIRPQGHLIDLRERARPVYERINFGSLRGDRDEVQRFIWENGDTFQCAERPEIDLGYRLTVDSVRPSVRVGPDGLVVQEVVATYYQTLDLTAAELRERGVRLGRGVAAETPVQLWGGGVLVFDQFGRARFHQRKPLADWRRQQRRLRYLVRHGLRDSDGRYGFTLSIPHGQRFAAMHVADRRAGEDW